MEVRPALSTHRGLIGAVMFLLVMTAARASEVAPGQAAPAEGIRWADWSADAFARAQAAKKPIFLFISSPWTRANLWAEEKILSDPEVILTLNTKWIPILVNRDRRPDIDLRYQVAVNAVRKGETGWPLMAMLLEDGDLITGGSSFHLDDRRGDQGLRSLLKGMGDLYPQMRVAAAGNQEVVQKAFAREKEAVRVPEISMGLVEEVGNSLLKSLDKEYGGLGGAPRVPTPFAIELAGTLFARIGNETWLDVVSTTLRGMERGAIFDRVGGGFHRSTFDNAWRIPDYEKLITYNSTILTNYLMAFEATRDEEFRIPAERTTDYLLETLTDPAGGLYVGQWAASRADDPKGTFYAWTHAEFYGALTSEQAVIARAHFNVTEAGEVSIGPPERNLLYLAGSRAETASRLGIEVAKLRAAESSILSALQKTRSRRSAPPVERAIYVDSCSAGAFGLLEAARVLGREDAKLAGLGALDRMLAAIPHDGPLRHRVQPAPDPAVDPPLALDHITLARALLSGYELTGKTAYLDGAREVIRRAIELFWDTADGGFFDIVESPGEHGYLKLRRRLPNDIAYPSLPSMAARVLQRLAIHTGDTSLQTKSEACLRGLIKSARTLDYRQAGLALAVEAQLRPPTRYILVADPGESRGLALEAAARHIFDPGSVIVRLSPDRDRAAVDRLPGRMPSAPFVLICVGESCGEPVQSPDAMKSGLPRKLNASGAL